MAGYRKLWWTLIAVLAITFGLLGYFGTEVYREAPPIPDKFMSTNGKVIATEESVLDGQTAWQSVGGMQLGSIWGHGAYQAPDWTADWLHRELLAWLDIRANEVFGKPYEQLAGSQQNQLEYELKEEYRTNTYDKASDTVILSERRIQAIEQTGEYYSKLFSDDPELRPTRVNYAMKENTLPSEARRAVMNDFFFWTAWAASTERFDSDITYTNNWPHETLIDNVPSAENIIWSIVSVILLIAGVGFLIWAWAFLRQHDEEDPVAPEHDPIAKIKLTPSQKALGKYLFIVVALFSLQVLLGGLTAHYTVEGQEFYGINISEWFPYSLTRTWHIQAAMFWIATGFLAAGLFLAPIINGGKDPKYQKLGVDILFWALVLVVAGTFIGNWLAIAQIMPEHLNFWLGHQGYEYVDLGRLWQIGKFLGIVFWLVLMMRCVVGAFKVKGDKNLLALFTASVVAIGLFYGAGFFYGERTHISIMEYWRWWIVHLWVEGFFEVFATASLAFIFHSMGLVSRRMATVAALASASLFMLGGVPGTFHHLYFAGTTTPVMAVGATFSALEVVPLIVLGYEAWENYSLQKRATWMQRIKWPLLCFVAVAFWNMLGAGVLGFMINPPISLYYVQGLNTTPTHAHAALFGVYGFLALGFVLLILRYIRPNLQFDEKLMKMAFWTMNIGLALMLFTSLLPVGFIQFYAAASEGLWYARSEAFMQQPLLQNLRWFRTLGDMVFIVGALGISWQVVKGLKHKSD
ncbi:nitric-oxide reductase large subunit [Idiomarina loihiensis]|jgi:nitric oxide reductase subunit B|uniref:Nitric oxide reductase large subunit n=1 Tax=Idiomarina loihiensis (strain ATCC BAA-735 / DSM 15497 / L2-TR) TaxID=283942 RepID=Q5QWK6_IDILO|nr:MULTISPECIES: nitric-oxide reductase large subunit [Idiomarina]AAV81029.1 Nitric oxide reductase large subunit [Idiomarina loihiensis L2TR]AGM35053.1 nitric oxide reductase large subunit [Idiomarina loihiensis GSL 199]MRJ44484.1 nitric-oxide reductase large subunit [Idiomarina loihiensis]PHQ91640.1 MAG: nitric-oxide reductase large subunit [Idiomarina sp.]TDO48090.1 nitric oxide reductase NorZ apoprotein [Idiomarina sp. 017G]|tara:strand:- start:4366 stop:6606 length:2241 start_codon:yes stop_codon:yes gene_type:complete